jgi:hypothetical protein
MMSESINIVEASDITDTCIELVESLYDDWYVGEEKIDWWGFFDRLDELGYCVTQIDSPAAKKIQRMVRALKNSG